MRGSSIRKLDDKKLVIRKTTFNIIVFAFGMMWLGIYMYAMFGNCYKLHKEIKEIKAYNTAKEQKIKAYYDYNWPDFIGRQAQLYNEVGEDQYKKEYLEKTRLPFPLILLIQLMLFSSIFLLNISRPRIRKFVFNREKGLLSYPGFMGFRRITIPFSEAVFTYTRIGAFMAKEGNSLAIVHPNGLTASVIDQAHISSFLSLYVWYMDKNRPLPPGTAFDSYRVADYLRRYHEGFPAPLFPSAIDIAEYSYTPKRADFISDAEYQAYLDYARKCSV